MLRKGREEVEGVEKSGYSIKMTPQGEKGVDLIFMGWHTIINPHNDDDEAHEAHEAGATRAQERA